MCVDAKMVEVKCLRLRSLLGVAKLSVQAGEDLASESYGALTFLLGELETEVTAFEADLLGLSGSAAAND